VIEDSLGQGRRTPVVQVRSGRSDAPQFPGHEGLGESRRNDGQLLPKDALVQGSTLLGYLNTDQWAVVMELEEDPEFVAARHDPTPFPHEALLQALLWQVGEDLAAQKP